MNYIRSFLFSAGMLVSMLFFASMGIILYLLFTPFSARYRFLVKWGRFTLWWLNLTCGIDYRVEGREHIPDKPAIIFCKHQSTWETLALPLLLPCQV